MNTNKLVTMMLLAVIFSSCFIGVETISSSASQDMNRELIYSSSIDNDPPAVSDFYINNTETRNATEFSFMCTDNLGLREAIFSTNASGSWNNQTTSLGGTVSWANFTVAPVVSNVAFNFTIWVYDHNETHVGGTGYRIAYIWNNSLPFLNLGTAMSVIDATNSWSNVDAYRGLVLSRNTTIEYENFLDSLINASQWSTFLKYVTFIEKYNLTWPKKKCDLAYALGNFSMVGNLPLTIPTSRAFCPEDKWALYGYYYAKEYGICLDKWNITAAFEQFDTAVNFSVSHTRGLPLYIYVNSTGATYANRYYDEDANTIACYLLFYSLLNVTEAYDRTTYWWDYLNSLHWNPNSSLYDPSLKYYRYTPEGSHYSFECEAGFFLKIINLLKYYVSDLGNYSRVFEDYWTRYLGNKWDSYQWLDSSTNRTTYSVVHLYSGNAQRRLQNTVGTWQTLLGAYSLFNEYCQGNIQSMLKGDTSTGTTPAWAALMSQTSYGLYSPTLKLFREMSNTEWNSNATALGLEYMLLTGIVPESTSIAHILEELTYEYLNDMDTRMIQINVTAHALKIPVVSSGIIMFIYGNSPCEQYFNESGIYEITFTDSWNNVANFSRMNDVPTNVIYFVPPLKSSTYSLIGTTSKIAGTSCMFHTLWTAQTQGANIVLIYFNSNNTGSWGATNETIFRNATGEKSAWGNYTTRLNVNSNSTVAWQEYAQDSKGVWTSTSVQYLTVNADNVQADVNRDGVVDIFDAVRLSGAFGSKSTDPKFDTYSDINGDGIVNIFDAMMLADRYGHLYP